MALEQLREQHKSELIALVEMHLSFCIEVTTEEWDKITAHVKREEEEAEKNSTKHHGKNSHNKYFTSGTSIESNKTNGKFAPPKEKELASNIFGTPLTPASLRQAMILIEFLNEDENYLLEGIFRKSGTQERQQDLRFMLNNGVKVDLKANRFTPVDVSCVLKEFIQKLPEPLLTNNHFELHYELAKTLRTETPPDEVETKNAKRLKIIQLLLHLLPELNRDFFMSIMALLHRVAQAIDVTRMDERSLATMFGQHLLCPRNWTPKQVQKNIDTIVDAMDFLLVNYDTLFSGPRELVLDAEKKIERHKLAAIAAQKERTKTDDIDGSTKRFVQPGTNPAHMDEEDGENHTVVTFCQRKDPQDTITDQALAELYAQVQAMPETPQKRKLIKQFNRQNGLGTPMNVTGKSGSSSISSKWKSLIPPLLRPKH